MRPPPMVAGGEGVRMMKGSPAGTATGVSVNSWTMALDPGSSRSRSSSRSRAAVSTVPVSSRTTAPPRSSCGAEPSSVSSASSHREPVSRPGDASAVPRGQIGLLDPAQIDGGAPSRWRRFDRAAMDLKAPDPRPPAAGHQFDLVTDAQDPPPQRAGHDGAEARHREDPVGRQPEDAGIGAPAGILRQARQAARADLPALLPSRLRSAPPSHRRSRQPAPA